MIDTYQLQKLIQSRSLAAEPCRTFSDHFTYFIYGKPKFRVADEQLARDVYDPVVLIFEGSACAEPDSAIFPFDVSAFWSDPYQQSLHRRMKELDFHLPGEELSSRRHVAAFFGNTRNYVNCTPQIPAKNFKEDFEVAALVQLYKHHRPSPEYPAIELRAKGGVSLPSQTLSALIVSDETEQGERFRKFTHEFPKLAIHTYERRDGVSSIDYLPKLEEIARTIEGRNDE